MPSFHFNSVWQDPRSGSIYQELVTRISFLDLIRFYLCWASVFGEIYDEDYFIESVAESVRVVRRLPDYILDSVGNNVSLIHNFKVKAWAPASFYVDNVLPKLRETG